MNLFLSSLSLLACATMVSSNVVLIGKNVTLSFDDVEANFTPSVEGSGECGVLHLAVPIDACSTLARKVDHMSDICSSFVLIVRGGCSFESKVRTAQKAGYKAAIVYGNEDDDLLVAMAGNAAGIKIHAVYISKASGEKLAKYAGFSDMELWIIQNFENSAWSIMAISFISLLAMSAVLATCFFVRRHRIRRDRPRAPPRVREFHGMSSRLVRAMPSLIFTAVLEDISTSRTCAICLEDYSVGEKLRILPCRHKFHAFCVDSWLTTWRTFCPVCKRDARTNTVDPSASESTPLLSSAASSPASSSVLSSFRSSLASSPATHISSTPLQSPSGSRLQSPYAQHSRSLRSYNQFPSMSFSQSSIDLRNVSSQRSHGSHLISPHPRYISPYAGSPISAASTGFFSSSHRQRHNDSALSFSPFASTRSLPDC